MKLSKQTADAIEILAFCKRLEEDGALIKVGDIGEAIGLSRQMALKLCYLLHQEGFLETVRGPKGGVRLSKKASEATIGEIVRALELQPSDKRAAGGASLFGGFIDEAFEAFLSVLDQHRLDDLAKKPGTGPARSPRAKGKTAKPARVVGANAHKAASPSRHARP